MEERWPVPIDEADRVEIRRGLGLRVAEVEAEEKRMKERGIEGNASDILHHLVGDGAAGRGLVDRFRPRESLGLFDPARPRFPIRLHPEDKEDPIRVLESEEAVERAILKSEWIEEDLEDGSSQADLLLETLREGRWMDADGKPVTCAPVLGLEWSVGAAPDGRITADDLKGVRFDGQEALLHALDLQVTLEEIEAHGLAGPLTVQDVDDIHALREAGPIRNLLEVKLPGGRVAHLQEDPLSEGAGDPPGPGPDAVICGKPAEGAEPAKEGTRLCKSCIKGRDAYPAVYGVPGG